MHFTAGETGKVRGGGHQQPALPRPLALPAPLPTVQHSPTATHPPPEQHPRTDVPTASISFSKSPESSPLMLLSIGFPEIFRYSLKTAGREQTACSSAFWGLPAAGPASPWGTRAGCPGGLGVPPSQPSPTSPCGARRTPQQTTEPRGPGGWPWQGKEPRPCRRRCSPMRRCCLLRRPRM